MQISERGKIHTTNTQTHDHSPSCVGTGLFSLNIRVYGSYQLLIPTKLLNQVFLVVSLKSRLRKFFGRNHDLPNRYEISVSQMTTDISSPSLSSFILHHPISNKSNMIGATNGAGNYYPSTTPEFTGQEIITLPQHLSSRGRKLLPFHNTWVHGAGNYYPSTTPEFTSPILVGFVLLNL